MKLKKIAVSLCMAFVFISSSMNVKAVEVVQIPATEIDSVYYQNVDSNGIEGWPEGPNIYSEAGIVMDIDSGAILYAKNIDDPHYPASITKILTALVALEHNELTDIVTITSEDYNFLELGDAHIGLKDGEEITMEDTLYGTLLASGNEAAHALGSNTEGGYDNFLKLMNEKAAELGCMNSNFTNTHGLHDDNHYTSARDMALIGAAAFQNEDFRRITGTLQYTIPTTNVTNETRTFQQNHKMLFEWRDQYYEYCVGGKTGYTDQSLNTLVTFATKDDVNLVSVVMRTHGSGNVYVDTRAMMDYTFENFTKVSVTTGMVDVEGLDFVDDGAYVMLPEGITFEQLEANVEIPTKLGSKSGSITYTYEGQPVGKVSITITDEYYNELHGIEEIKEEQKEQKQGMSLWIKILLVAVVVFILLFLCFIGFVNYKRKQIRKKKREMRMRQREESEY